MFAILVRKKNQYVERKTKKLNYHWFNVDERVIEKLSYTKRETKQEVF
jgi:hypothetical protein